MAAAVWALQGLTLPPSLCWGWGSMGSGLASDTQTLLRLILPLICISAYQSGDPQIQLLAAGWWLFAEVWMMGQT